MRRKGVERRSMGLGWGRERRGADWGQSWVGGGRRACEGKALLVAVVRAIDGGQGGVKYWRGRREEA